MNLFYQPLIPEGVLYLTPEESRHCVKVLRKNKGDTILVTDGQGFFYHATIEHSDIQKCTFLVTEKEPAPVRNFFIHIAISPTKNTERLEWFIEKAVEIGVDKITFMECANTERPYIKLDRFEKIAVSAMKQSLKASLPVMNGLLPFSDVANSKDERGRFIAFVDPSNPDHLKNIAAPKDSYIILIGPEGDFTERELFSAIENGFLKTSLGNSRLRTETAGLAACHILNLINT